MSAKIMRANGTVRVCRFAKIDATDNNSVLEADANDPVIGIAQEGGRTAPIPEVTTDPVEAAQAGENVRLHILGETALLRLGAGGVTAGGELESDADGNGVAAAATAATVRQIGAVALETASANELCKVLVVKYARTNPA